MGSPTFLEGSIFAIIKVDRCFSVAPIGVLASVSEILCLIQNCDLDMKRVQF